MNLGPRDTLEKAVNHIYKTTGMLPSVKKQDILNWLAACEDPVVLRFKRPDLGCAGKTLNSPEISHRLYRQGLDRETFTTQLTEVILPVYQSARNCGFRNWEYLIGEKQ